MGNIFVRRPIFAMVIAIMIVVLGLIAIRSMPIEQYPDITPPVVEVSAEYLGADALTIEQSVATPLEESVNGVSDMIYMQSTNSNNGSMSLQVSFAVGTDPDMNTIFTQNRVSSATPMLPQVVIKQGVTTEKTMSSFIQVLSLTRTADTTKTSWAITRSCISRTGWRGSTAWEASRSWAEAPMRCAFGSSPTEWTIWE